MARVLYNCFLGTVRGYKRTGRTLKFLYDSCIVTAFIDFCKFSTLHAHVTRALLELLDTRLDGPKIQSWRVSNFSFRSTFSGPPRLVVPVCPSVRRNYVAQLHSHFSRRR